MQQAEGELAMARDVFSRTISGKLSAQFHAFVEGYMSPAFDLRAVETCWVDRQCVAQILALQYVTRM